MPFRTLLNRFAGACVALTALSGAATAADRAIIVLDASGSMWGQIEGEAKITIARETLSQVLGKIPDQVELGLLAYGHRRKGECSDIELIVPAGRGTAPAIADAVGRLKPKGKTPLSDAVKQAAEALKYTEDKATVILITDGLETCDADPCALARQLEETGVDFTAHVVGFGLSAKEGREVACLAEETGGIYLSAGNSEELVEALDRTVAAPPAPDPQATLTAEDRVPIARAFQISWDGPGATGDRIEIFDAEGLQGGGVIRSVPPTTRSDGAAFVEMPAPGRPGRYVLRYHSAEAGKVIAERPLTVSPLDVAVMAEPPVKVGEPFDVAWTGPGMAGDRIELWDPAARGAEGRRLSDAAVRTDASGSNIVEMQAPAAAGTLELRYWNGDNQMVLATSTVEVEDIFASLDAPDSVPAAGTVPVSWDGPGARYDQIRVFDSNALNGEGRLVSKVGAKTQPDGSRVVRMVAPARTGAYELQYYSGEAKRVLATRVLEVTEAEVSLDHDEAVEGGTTFEVQWTGPGQRYDEIVLFDPNAFNGEGKKIRSTRIRSGDYDNRKVKLIAPVRPGDYELRYYNADNRAVMAKSPIVVIEVQASLDFESPAAAGSSLKITWDGPGARYDEVYIFDPTAKGGDGASFKSSRVRSGDFEGKTVTLPVPAKPGQYEVRYWNGDNRTVMANAPLEVTETPVSLEFEPQAPAGSTLGIVWEGPGAKYDEVYIFDPRAKQGKGGTFKSQRVRGGDFENRTVTLVVPATPGEYEVRYWNGDSRAVMASAPLEVTEIATDLQFTSPVPAGSTMTITWDGPGARYDEVYIFDPRAKAGKGATFKSQRVRNADFENRTVKLVVPATPGDYEIRYWNGDSRKVLASKPLAVTPITVGLEAPSQTGQGTTVAVSWEGPGARYDEIHLFDPTAKGGKGAVTSKMRVRNADFDNRKVALIAPISVGAKELRYYSGDSRKVLATRPIEVTPVETSLDAPSAVETETTFGVGWKGPGARYDEVQIFDGTTQKVVSKVRVRSGQDNRVSINAPKTPGEYQLRYYNGDSRAVMAAQPLSVQ